MTIQAAVDILRDEVIADPLGRGYAGMTDQQVATDLNTVYRTTNKTSMTASDVLNAVDVTEYNALSAADQDKLWQLLAIGELNPFGIEATLVTNLFGGGSTTVTDLASLRVNNLSRAEELGYPRDVSANEVNAWRT
jgi:hypothetical protein